jgi:Adenylate cyclase, family 3 (some proteins contain HAMP domain)
MALNLRLNSLDDFLISRPLTIDGMAGDGWGASFAIKGREIEATILFADISNFSGRTLDLSSTETLAFVNHFFSWITADALTDTHGIVDKYIGDEIMIVFAREFGSTDPFAEAVTAAQRFGENDVFGFCPHIGIASGIVTVGWVGTPVKYNCSVFGRPVALAARCAGVRSDQKDVISASIVFPAAEWSDRKFDELFPPQRYDYTDGSACEQPSCWEMQPSQPKALKNMPDIEVVSVENGTFWSPSLSAERWARKHVADIRAGELPTAKP